VCVPALCDAYDFWRTCAPDAQYTVRHSWQFPRQLHLTISINKWKIVDPYFQALRNKVEKSKKTIFLYEDGNFESDTREDEGGVPTKSMNRAAK
jgi:hypothetical protein